MAVRTNSDDVMAIMGDTTLDTDVIDSLIVAANAVVNQIFLNDTTMDSTLLTEIEKWFTAHMIASSIQRTGLIEKVGDAAITYTGKFGEKLSSTPYGQMVLTIDVSGKMAKAGKAGASMYAITSFDE